MVISSIQAHCHGGCTSFGTKLHVWRSSVSAEIKQKKMGICFLENILLRWALLYVLPFNILGILLSVRQCLAIKVFSQICSKIKNIYNKRSTNDITIKPNICNFKECALFCDYVIFLMSKSSWFWRICNFFLTWQNEYIDNPTTGRSSFFFFWGWFMVSWNLKVRESWFRKLK